MSLLCTLYSVRELRVSENSKLPENHVQQDGNLLKYLCIMTLHSMDATYRGQDVTYSETSISIYMGVLDFSTVKLCDLLVILLHFAMSHVSIVL